MSFKNKKLTDLLSDVDGTNNYAQKTDSILKVYSLVSNLEVEFKAFLTELSDNFQSSWNSEQVFGRMDPMGTFQNTKRSVSLGWDIPAGSLDEAKYNMEAISTLTSMLYPGYSSNPVSLKGEGTFTTANSISRNPLVRIKFANLISANDDYTAKKGGLLGWIDGVNIQPQIDQGFIIEGKKHYPKLYKLSLNLNVLHEHDLGFDKDNQWLGINNPKWPFGE
jgi:hypothetical protein